MKKLTKIKIIYKKMRILTTEINLMKITIFKIIKIKFKSKIINYKIL
jgi:hypothetical protein